MRKKSRESSKLVEKSRGSYPTRYKGMDPDRDMKKKVKSGYTSRYSSSLIPDKESEMKKKANYTKRYQ